MIELRSPSDEFRTLRGKMEEYQANGARLGWRIDPLERRVHVCTADAALSPVLDPTALSAEPILSGFVLNPTDIWEPSL